MSAAKTRIMYIQGDGAPGRIGRVRLSKTGRTLHYGDIELVALSGGGVRGNYMDAASRDEYWVSGPRKDGQDTLYPGVVEIDDEFAISTGERSAANPRMRSSGRSARSAPTPSTPRGDSAPAATCAETCGDNGHRLINSRWMNVPPDGPRS